MVPIFLYANNGLFELIYFTDYDITKTQTNSLLTHNNFNDRCVQFHGWLIVTDPLSSQTAIYIYSFIFYIKYQMFQYLE